MRAKKVMYAKIFKNQGPAMQIDVPKGKSVNSKLYKGAVRTTKQLLFAIFKAGKGCRDTAPAVFPRSCPL